MLSQILTGFIDLLLPPRATERVVRTLTLEALQLMAAEDGLPYHDERVTALVWELKYHGTYRSLALAGEYLADELLAIASEEVGTPLLVPVPMHPKRRRERGHNHTELLCQSALHRLQGALEYAPKALKRVAHTKTQQGLPKAVRERNVANSMSADPAVVAGRACIVVDDVMTTGATLAEAKRALRAAGARVVRTIALARS